MFAAGAVLLGGAVLDWRGARASEAAVTIDLDMRAAPGLQPWAEEVRRRAYAWWAIINDELAFSGYTPTRRITLRFSNAMPDGIAGQESGGDSINLNAPYIAAHPTYYNYIAHELVHVFQNYPQPLNPWLTEGVADYVRYYVIFPQDPERLFKPDSGTYRRGYQQAAALLDWVERTHGVGSVRALNATLHGGGDGEAMLEKMTGLPLDSIWDKVLTALREGSPVPRG